MGSSWQGAPVGSRQLVDQGVEFLFRETVEVGEVVVIAELRGRGGRIGPSPEKSLFFSLVSVVRNWRAFLVYAMAVALVSSIVGGFLVGLSSALPVPALATVLAVLAGLFLSFVLTPILMASIYLSYRDVFADDV